MTQILQHIRKTEQATTSHRAAPKITVEPDDTDRRIRDKIVLDPRLDPDPYNLHGISLYDRLLAMGWPV